MNDLFNSHLKRNKDVNSNSSSNHVTEGSNLLLYSKQMSHLGHRRWWICAWYPAQARVAPRPATRPRDGRHPHGSVSLKQDNKTLFCFLIILLVRNIIFYLNRLIFLTCGGLWRQIKWRITWINLIVKHTNLRLRPSSSETLGAHRLLDPVHFELVPLAVAHGTLLCFLQSHS